MGASPPRLSSDASLSGRATNAWVMGASADDVPTLSSLDGVVRSMGTTTDALPPGMVRTCSGFFCHGGYYVRDGCYRHIGHQHGREASGQKKQTVRNVKLDHPVSQEATASLGRQQGQRAPNEPPVDHQGGSIEKMGLENKSSANDEVKSDAGKNPEQATTE
jgi:hypothetical protein